MSDDQKKPPERITAFVAELQQLAAARGFEMAGMVYDQQERNVASFVYFQQEESGDTRQYIIELMASAGHSLLSDAERLHSGDLKETNVTEPLAAPPKVRH